MKPDLIHLPIERRTFIRRTAKLAALTTLSSIVPFKIWASNPPTLVTAIRDVSNPYHTTWNQGGQAFAKAVGAEHVTLLNEGNSEKGIADIEAIVTKTGGNVVLNIEPNDLPDARPIAEICSKAGAYFTTQWNKPPDKHPWDFDPYYVAHISFDGIQYGEETAKAANDDMAIGALEALRTEKLASKIPITGIDGIKAAVDAIRN